MILEALRGWLNRRANARRKRRSPEDHNPLVSANPAPASDLGSQERTSFTIHKADNGHVVDYVQFTDDGHGGNYRRGVYIVPVGGNLTEAVTTILVTNTLNRK